MYDADDIAEAIWTAVARVLDTGTPDPLETSAEHIADAIWTYGTRELTEEPAAWTGQQIIMIM